MKQNHYLQRIIVNKHHDKIYHDKKKQRTAGRSVP